MKKYVLRTQWLRERALSDREHEVFQCRNMPSRATGTFRGKSITKHSSGFGQLILKLLAKWAPF